ncbi:MAG TPA: alpha/beta fold hydrolase [Anaerolineales bacterium]|nr:alpha/beta fold hydrolase [Anaerolineales bacterium]HLO29798.1 alpha/beta fold hydrolase [Anaerolineales bacterium]
MKLEIISKYPVDEQRPTPLLFIHGTLHTASCWEVHFLDYFAQHRYAAHAVNLRGHGNSEGREKLRWTRIADFVEYVENAVRQLPIPPILIGHSMGGFIIQKYLEDHDAPAAVLLSSASPAGLLPTAIRTARRQPWVFAKVNLTMSLLPFIATPQLVGEAFFSDDLPKELLLEYWKQTQDDSFMAFLDMVALDLPKPAKVKTPLLVLGVARDNMIGPHEIEATARAYHTWAEIIPDVAHNSMLEQRWESVAERILLWLNEREVVDNSVTVAKIKDGAQNSDVFP